MTRHAVRLALAVAALVIATSAVAAPTITKGPYLQNATATSVVVMWETSVYSTTQVDYSTTTSSGRSYASAATLHKATLTGLAADTLYHYTVTSVASAGTVSSTDSTFRTAVVGTTPFRFSAYGDSRTYPTSHAAVIKAISARYPRLVLHTGDIVRDGTVASYWQSEFFDPAASLIRKTPLYPTLGNHEKNSSNYYKYFTPPTGGGTSYEQWYSFNYGNVHFISIDTGAGYSVGSAQYSWLANDLKATTAEWIVVFTHYPAYSSGMHGGTAAVQSVLVPLFEKYGVDMVFSGHDHIYERSRKSGIYYFVTGGGGAELQQPQLRTNPYRQFSRSVYHHITVDISGGTAVLKARTNDGVAFDSVTIQHPPVASFTASPVAGKAPLTVYFSDLSTNAPTSWKWTFGDGASSTSRSPSHPYAKAGVYSVSLTATNQGGSSTKTKTNYVTVTVP